MKRFNQLFKKCTNYMQHGSENGSESSRFGSLSILSRQSVLTIICLLTLGIGEVWGEGEFYNMYIGYSFGGEAGNAQGSDKGTGLTQDLGILSSGTFTLTGVYLKCWDKQSGSTYQSQGGQLCYTNKGGSTQYVSCSTRKDKNNGDTYEWQNSNPNVTLANYTEASGSYAFECWGQTWDWDGSGGNGDWYFPYNSGHYVLNYKIAPPAVSSFSVSETNHISGAGTEGDPYLLPYNGTLSLSISGSKEHTDANSSEQYYNTSSDDAWSTTATKSITVTSTELQSVTVKMRYYNSTASIGGAESEATIYYKVASYDITLDDNGSYDGNGSAIALYLATALTSIVAPSRTGYHVTGYYTNDDTPVLIAEANGNLKASTAYTNSSSQWEETSNSTLYAQWAPTTYTVTFNEHDATGHGTISTDATYDAAMPTIAVPTRVGYIFGGYWDGENGTGTQYYNENGLSEHNWDKASDTELHAQWTGIRYTVAFDANGGTGTMEEQTMQYGVSADLTDNDEDITRDGYYFLGWNTNMDGTGTAIYNHKNVSNLTSTQGATVTLYAQWAKTYTLYFLNIKTTGWQVGDTQAETDRFAYAFISYDSHVMYPLGTWTDGVSQGARMTESSSITVPNVHNQAEWCWSISGVPEGATIIFSDNQSGDSHKTGNLSGWTADKPYYCKGNDSWYALDGDNEISKMTNMSVHIGEGDFGSWRYYALDKYDNSAEGTYAIIYLNKDKTYQYKYSNWYDGGESGAATNNAYIINGSETTYDWGGPALMDGDNNYMVKTDSHASGEYKFILRGWSGAWGTSPYTKIYVPRGVNLTTTNPTEAKLGESVTVSFQADAWTNIGSGYSMDHPTYYFEFSKDNSNWTTVATVSPTSNKMQATASYTFNAQSGYFRVKLVNDQGLASYSGSTAFTAYTTKSFYVYNPYNNSSNKWRWLHLYTWDSNDGNRTYNGTWNDTWGYIDCAVAAGTKSTNCLNGNMIKAMGDDWFYITIDERANCFMLVGESEYNAHQTVTCYVSGYIQNGKYMIYTENGANYVKDYEAKGVKDFRLKYNYGTPAKQRYSDIYNTTIDGTTITTSMWMNANDPSASITIQQYEEVDTDVWQWVDKVTYNNDGTDGFDGIVGTDYYGVGKNYGRVFQMKLNIDTETPAYSTVSNVDLYTGPYYVRTDGLDGGWNNYNKADHVMHYSEFSLTGGTPAFDYYLCKWIGSSGTNVKFTVANDYNRELVASLEGDATDGDPLYGIQKLPAAANVRFAWNSQTNTLTRAYLSGSSNVSDRFLVLVGDEKMFGPTGCSLNSADDGNCKVSALNNYEMNFTDDKNWLYEAAVQAQPGANVKLTAKYNNQTQYFWGGPSSSVVLLGGTGSTKYTIRVVYDFKTNRLVRAFIPNTTITEALEINTDLMIIREAQEDAQQILFSGSGALSDVKTVWGAMKFNKYTLNNKAKTEPHGNLSPALSVYARDLYWISFPFDVKLSDVFGFGTYGTHWIIEYYDGKGRAKNGFWADSPSNWKFVTPAMRGNGGDDETGYILKANEGYILALDLDELTLESEIWENGADEGYLYFPSTGDIGNIEAITKSVEIDQDGYECTIGPRFDGGDDRTIKDSYWHCIGVPSYANATHGTNTDWTTGQGANAGTVDAGDYPNYSRIEDWTTPSLPYLYQWNSSDNTLSPISSASATFQPMYSYLVQYNQDTIKWMRVNATPSSVAARLTETPDREYQLALIREDEEQDHTYVRLTDDASVTNRFEFNYDLSKEYNAGRGNIWTVTADTVEVAGNSMPKPLQTILVPVGVKVVANGEYTMSMPEGTNGEDVYLIDNAYGTRTNLGLMPYTVTLTAGTYDSRFALEFGPIQETATGVENDGLSRSDELNDANDDVRKVFVGGRLYIIRDGKVYDAAGQRVE